jgi:hypothetical protein
MYIPRACSEVVQRQGAFPTSEPEIIAAFRGCSVDVRQGQSCLSIGSASKAHWIPLTLECSKHANRCGCQAAVKSIE